MLPPLTNWVINGKPPAPPQNKDKEKCRFFDWQSTQKSFPFEGKGYPSFGSGAALNFTTLFTLRVWKSQQFHKRGVFTRWIVIIDKY